MDRVEKTEQLNNLFEIYQELLTEKQKKYYELYYYEDYSLQEIAEIFEISRNAVFDQLKKVEKHLNHYEEKLKIYNNKEQRIKYLEKYEESKDEKYLKLLRKMDE
ncbi:conserved hypothetical protein [Alteracholeplasma palmae J233]|uniref:UPF0122 protein BN85404770 n=1 Tax=Alteracholeplasma palmae (strain ATCC 49389 / J233) TaxID=1318466 RepID=U4KK62_ALTPJ|nr:sigma factor-like helix-turn-helix DNA-binding protein [Alteracholeplasma palmae]CCV64054.1 conserved hypothetical protein [Alteracholeplasma palmae J233]